MLKEIDKVTSQLLDVNARAGSSSSFTEAISCLFFSYDNERFLIKEQCTGVSGGGMKEDFKSNRFFRRITLFNFSLSYTLFEFSFKNLISVLIGEERVTEVYFS